MPPKTRCLPRFFPQPGHEDTFTHDARKDGRYFVVGAGHCNGVFTDSHIADLQTNGFSGYEKRSTKRWTGVGGVEEIWASFCDRLHQGGCHRNTGLPDGWTAPTPVVRDCPAPAAPAAVPPAPAVVIAAPPSAATPPQTPRATTKTGGSGNTWASPLVVRSSVSPSPLRPPPQYHAMAPNTSGSPRPRTALNPNGSAASTSAGSSVLSAISSSSSVSSASEGSLASTRSPRKPVHHSRVQSSPNGGYDTDFFYEDDTDGESGPEATQTRFWAVRGLNTMFTDVDDAFDALRQNMDRLRYMEVRTSTSLTKLRRFAAS
ncbi:hypothetical protein C8F04DRAFT_1250001 [Mycena alexandri]|uniref:Uncharacterized protein n=1 Tax=Mycena alexandri TaxID=1745969 RepID=A0AAD6TIB1_9AGAR|nr:hypothetical protein C8F04DRAFT_1250001 [Mycena alexandri]